VLWTCVTVPGQLERRSGDWRSWHGWKGMDELEGDAGRRMGSEDEREKMK